MPYDELPDEQLVTLITQGDRDALGALYDRHGKAVFGFVYYLLQDPGRAQDVVQEVFLRVWLKASGYHAERGKFQTWLMSMAHHRAVDEMRRTRRQQNTLESAGRLTLPTKGGTEDIPLKEALQSEVGEVVRAALANIPAEQYKVIELAYYQGYSQSEIAERLQEPLGTVKTRMRLGMQKLRAALAPFQETE